MTNAIRKDTTRIVWLSLILLAVPARPADAQMAKYFTTPLEGGWPAICLALSDLKNDNCVHQGFGRATDNSLPALQRDWWVTKRSGYHLAYDVLVPYTAQQRGIQPPFSQQDLAGLRRVFAPANGVIKMARETYGVDGYWVVVEHELPPGDPDGPFVCSVFFHLVRPSQGGIRLKVGSSVSIGQTIGYVSPLATDDSDSVPHQHYGIRKGPYAGDPSILNPITHIWYYPGYTTSQPQLGRADRSHSLVIQEWFNPYDFLRRHSALSESSPSVSTSTPAQPTASSSPQRLAIVGSGFEVGASIELLLPNGSISSKPPQVLSVSQDGTRVEMVATIGMPVAANEANKYSVTVINPDGQRTLPFKFSVSTPATPIVVAHQFVVQLFNVDDLIELRLNGQVIKTVGFQGMLSADITTVMSQGPNDLNIEIENGPDGGWTYGFRLIADGTVVVERSCGTVGVFGCDNNSNARGTVLTATYIVALGGTVSGVSSAVPHFSMMADGATVVDPDPLRVTAGQDGAAAVTFDSSTSEPGVNCDIVGQSWTIEGLGQVSTATQFRYAVPIGIRTVTIQLSTACQASPIATAMVDISAAAPVITGIVPTAIIASPSDQSVVLSGSRLRRQVHAFRCSTSGLTTVVCCCLCHLRPCWHVYVHSQQS